MKIEKHLYYCSLGKDSLAEMILAKKAGVPIDRVVFADMQDAAFPEEKKLLEKAQNYFGIEFDVLKSAVTFEQLYFKSVEKGKYQRDCRGFPLTIGKGCWVKRDLKIAPVSKFEKDKSLSGYTKHFGFAKGEEKRLEAQAGVVSLLLESGLSGEQAKDLNRAEGLLNPLYDIFDRIGCWFCPKQPLRSWYKLHVLYPELWDKLKWFESKQDYKRWKITPTRTVEELEELFKKEKFQLKHGQIKLL